MSKVNSYQIDPILLFEEHISDINKYYNMLGLSKKLDSFYWCPVLLQ